MTFDPKVTKKDWRKKETKAWRAGNAINFGVSASDAWRQRLSIKFDHDLDL